MIHKHILSLAIGSILCSAGVVTMASTPEGASIPAFAGDDDDGDGIRDFVFGLRTAGVYLSDIQATGFPAIKAVTTQHADGTFTTSETDDFVPGDVESISQGVWKRVGLRRTKQRFLQKDFDANGEFELWFRVDYFVDLARDLQSGTVEGVLDVFLAIQDPLDPNAMPVFTVPFTGTTRRMNVP